MCAVIDCMALGQCDEFIQQHGLIPETAYNTAGAAKLLHKEGVKDVGVISSVVAAETYHLNILQEDIQNSQQNFTRFLILELGKVPHESRIAFKTSVVFCLENSPGGLWKALSSFASLNIQLTEIESREIHAVRKALGPPVDLDINEKRWGYVFHVDVKRHADEEPLTASLLALHKMTTFYRVLES